MSDIGWHRRLILLVICGALFCCCNSSDLSSANDAVHGKRPFVNISGDIKLGGLVAIYDSGGQVNKQCKKSGISAFGIQRVEAMKFAIRKINEKKIIPGVTLGIEIRDSCGTETRALDEALHFVTDRVPMCKADEEKRVPIFGVVGASMSLLTAAVANLLRLFQIPLVSYAATSTELTNKDKYDFLLRTVPPDRFQSEAMVDFITDTLGWESVFVVYSVGSYGEYGFESFQDAVEKRKQEKEDKGSLCVVDQRKVKKGISDMATILEHFTKSYPDVVGIVCYCEIPDTVAIVELINKFEKFKKFRLIGSDATLSGTKTNKSIIFSLAYDKNRVSDFYTEYHALNPENVSKVTNPWFSDFWDESCAQLKSNYPLQYKTANCTQVNIFEKCLSNGNTCEQDDKVPYTIDAVYAYAYAIRDVLNNTFSGNTTNLLKMNLKNRTFFDKYLKPVKFNGRSGNITFNESVERGAYDIIWFPDSEKQRFVGKWSAGSLDVNGEDQAKLENAFGKSTCRPKCKPGYGRDYKYNNRCCWDCKKCGRLAIQSNYSCKDCLDGEQASEDLTTCVSIPIEHIQTSWKVVIAVLSVIGVLCTLYTVRVFLKNNDTPLVKASGRELTYLLLLGIFMLFCNPLFMLPEPSETVCGIYRFNFGIFLCLCYGSLLVKTNRIARIFTGKQDLLFLTPNWQLILTAFFMMPQILITSIGLIKDVLNEGAQHISYVNFDIKPGTGYRMCKSETADLYGTLIYNIILVILCTYYAFVTRKVPANFNESRYIGFVMYTTIVIWCAFLPVYFGISSEHRVVFLMLDHILNALTLLVGLFGVKLYILVLRPDKNSRASSKLRSVTFFSEGENGINGSVYIDAPANGHVNTTNGWYKTISNSTLLQEPSPSSTRNRSPKREKKEFCTENNHTSSTQTNDCGTSTVQTQTTTGDDVGDGATASTDVDVNEMFHQPLHKTFTM